MVRFLMLLCGIALAQSSVVAMAATDYKDCLVDTSYSGSGFFVMEPSSEFDGKPSWQSNAENMRLRWVQANNRWEIRTTVLDNLAWYLSVPAADQDTHVFFSLGGGANWKESALFQGYSLRVLETDCGPTFNVPARITVAAIDATGAPASDPAIVALLNSVVVTDDNEGIIANFTHNAPAVFPLGETTITFEAVDSRNTVGRATTIVDVLDQTKPDIQLNGSASVTVNHGTIWTDPGAQALDRIDNNLTASIVVSGVVDTSAVGVYPIQYSVTDAAGNTASVTRQVTVQDRTAPVVTPPSPVVLAAIDANGLPASHADVASFLNAGTAVDAVDGSGLTVTAAFNSAYAHIGISNITFSAMDAAGNLGTAVSTITVTDQTPPVMQLLGEASMVVILGQSYVEPGVTAIDNVDGDISSYITTVGSVNDAVAGFYSLEYRILDTAGNAASITRGVSVQDLTAPVITPPADITLQAENQSGVAAAHADIQAFLAGATVIDDVDGSLLAITHNAPSQFPVGTTTVQFSARDSAGNIGYAQATVTVVAHKPVNFAFEGIGRFPEGLLLVTLVLMRLRKNKEVSP